MIYFIIRKTYLFNYADYNTFSKTYINKLKKVLGTECGSLIKCFDSNVMQVDTDTFHVFSKGKTYGIFTSFNTDGIPMQRVESVNLHGITHKLDFDHQVSEMCKNASKHLDD